MKHKEPSIFCSFVAMALLASAAPSSVARTTPTAEPSSLEIADAESFATPSGFEPNLGQFDERVRFVYRTGGGTVFVTAEGFVLAAHAFALPETESDLPLGLAPKAAPAAAPAGIVRVDFVDAHATAPAATAKPLPGHFNYFLGDDPSRWRSNVPRYGEVRIPGIYPGIDLVYYSNEGPGVAGDLEYDYVVAPGGDPSRIGLRVTEGSVSVEDSGDLRFEAGGAAVRQRRPVAYQVYGDAKRPVAAEYVLSGDGEVSLRVGSFDPTVPLVVDPVISFATYLGGGGGEETVAVTADASSSAYVVGHTASRDFPTVPAFQTLRGAQDVFVTKFAPDGRTLVFSTFIGGTGSDVGNDIAVGADGTVYVGGTTYSADFPTSHAIDRTFDGGPCVSNGQQVFCGDGFAAKLSRDGASLVYSTFVGGSGSDQVLEIDVDRSGAIGVSGATTSTDFPLAGPVQDSFGGGRFDGFAAKINPAGSALAFSTYLGGDGLDGCYVAFGHDGAVFLASVTDSRDFLTTTGSFQRSYSGGQYDGAVTKLSPNGATVLYSTYLGGAGRDDLVDLCVDSAGSAIVSGMTDSSDFRVVNAVQSVKGRKTDGFISKLDPKGSALVLSTYYGGDEDEVADEVDTDGLEFVYVALRTTSRNLRTVNPVQAVYGGGASDAALLKMTSTGTMVYATYFGGSGTDLGRGVAFDAAGNGYLCGITDSPDLLRGRPEGEAFQSALRGQIDSFLVRITEPYTISWEAPASGGGAPRNLTARLEREGASATATPQSGATNSPGLCGYTVYRSTERPVRRSPNNIFATVGPNQTSVSTAPGGYYVVTACTGGVESDGSNETGAGGDGPALTVVKVSAAKVLGKGRDFTSEVEVFVDGIAFSAPAAVVNGKKVVQTGALAAGLPFGEYLTSCGGKVTIGFRNSDGGVTAVRLE